MPASSLRGTCILCARPIAPADTLAVLANVLSAHVDCTETPTGIRLGDAIGRSLRRR